MNDFKVLIQTWYNQNKRNLPWRDNISAYKTWLSEVILQQTRVNQGLIYYKKFLAKYPTIYDLDNASEEEVLHLWQGLGYYSRARNLKYAAHQIVQDFGGTFPETQKELLQLKGVGDYTASAIASIAFDKPHAVVDGNVFRVISRLFEDSTPIDTSTGKKHFTALAQELLDTRHPGNYNQAVMELGALVCTPQSPHCDQCPVLDLCASGRNQTWDQYPVKSKKVKVKTRNLHYGLIFNEASETIIKKRNNRDIWRSLHDFPLIENNKNAFLPREDWESHELFHHFSIQSFRTTHQKSHKLTHQQLNIYFYEIKVNESISISDPYEKIKSEDIQHKPFPVVIQKMIEKKALFS